MIIDWTRSSRTWLDSLDAKAAAGDHIARRQLKYVVAGMSGLTDLLLPPVEDTERSRET